MKNASQISGSSCSFPPWKSRLNALLAFAVAIPAVIFTYCFTHQLGLQPDEESPDADGGVWSFICAWFKEHPVGAVNYIFFINVDILFWILSLIQGSTWLIDPYWTFIPVMIGHFFAAHPAARFSLRGGVALALIWVWSIRLTHSYFRREKWCWGWREDWRFADLRKWLGSHWWWISFFAAYISQHIFLVGITLPLYGIFFYSSEFNSLDAGAVVVCVAGIGCACAADTQLFHFMEHNAALIRRGEKPVPVLDSGLWYYSRHPNYFGEQMFWWGIAMFGISVGRWWTVIGAVVNSSCLAYVTTLVEKRMLLRKERAHAYQHYIQHTSTLIPWFKRRPAKPE